MGTTSLSIADADRAARLRMDIERLLSASPSLLGELGIGTFRHPRFSIALSLDCDVEGCSSRGECHRRCPSRRLIGDVPIIPGEVGTGPFGIATTLPPAMRGRGGVIVYGHGVFTVGRIDFNDAFERLKTIENTCRAAFLERIGIR